MTQRERRVKGRGKRKKRGPKLCEVWSGQKVAGTKVEGRGRKREVWEGSTFGNLMFKHVEN